MWKKQNPRPTKKVNIYRNDKCRGMKKGVFYENKIGETIKERKGTEVETKED